MECDPRGFLPEPDRCRRMAVRGYPTWIINGVRFEGALSLAQLAEASKFPGSSRP